MVYKLVVENDKLNKDMRRLLQIFPEGVLIQTKGKDSPDSTTILTNQEFDTRIYQIKNEIGR